MMSSNCIQHMRFDQIDEREAGANVIRELNYGPKESRARNRWGIFDPQPTTAVSQEISIGNAKLL